MIPETIFSPNYYQGRSESVRVIVIHHTAGTLDSAIDHFRNPANQVSAHYLISHDGSRVVQMVDENNTAWHARFANPFTIGIECEDYDGCPFSGYETLTQLIRDIASRHGIVLGTYTIQPHRAYVNTVCPSDVNMALIVAMATGHAQNAPQTLSEHLTVSTGQVHADVPVSIRHSAHVNAVGGLFVRPGNTTDGEALRKMNLGDGFYYLQVVDGQDVNGNNKWFLLEDGHYAWTGGATTDNLTA